ncbi:hypothetical protein KSB_51060 [Ktedonobacter robiniae]|uniref:Uncharacterized protein n=1 Tax=Ktedonobacter robiniae TaxID=2778365 RepID=A0ABQ3UUX5_9CHLR|nr:hypothetical protein KSB_51060 [Ktedonobacter robiniae]
MATAPFPNGGADPGSVSLLTKHDVAGLYLQIVFDISTLSRDHPTQ